MLAIPISRPLCARNGLKTRIIHRVSTHPSKSPLFVTHAIESNAKRDEDKEVSAAPTPSEQEGQPSADSDGLSPEEMARLGAMREAAKKKQADQSTNMFTGAFTEAKLVEWPSPQSALFQTLQVNLILLIAALSLLAVNAGLNQIATTFLKHNN